MLHRVRNRLRHLERLTRPASPNALRLLDQRWDELPQAVKTDAQVLGRRFAGCEGTHGVFPRCNLACTPCYHSKEAQQVRTDGSHTIAEVERQMAYLEQTRGPTGHAQLIGGEVTLLSPEDHAATLEVMRRHGRHPMSMSHGDFDYEYLERLAVDERGRRRFNRISFAGHFDSLMLGRRGIPRPRSEADLHPYRERFVAMFDRLRREHGVRSILAHNMTVTPRNLGEVAEVARACRSMGFRIVSFQPAAAVGNPKRWKEDYRSVTIDAVWREIERGAGTRLLCEHFQVGDRRCNRTAHGLRVGAAWHAAITDDPRDLRVRDAYLTTLRGIDLGGPQPLTAIRVARALARQPSTVAPALGWGVRLTRRAGLRALLRHGAFPLTFVVHAFMDQAVVREAWAATEQGRTAADPEIRAAQERLAACSYAMAHPDEDRLVPACVQHSVLDPAENRLLVKRLPMHPG